MKPCKRETDLVVETTGAEVLVYDLTTDAAHCLDADAAAVWMACDGETSVIGVAGVTGIDADAVVTTLHRLETLGLLEAGRTRRDAFRTAALAGAGAAAVAVPQIRSLIAPEAAQAATKKNNGEPCASPDECDSGLCPGAPNGTCA